ncbi:MAG: dephospho-CoA kinase [Clostridiaceae bacterium]|jgi:dephospho-CoA kinase|nr:dephospho-CoA kinase [Clostridiaceae bacterium]
MLVIGVTGGIGAGKSSVSAILKELGAIVIDADLIARQVVEPYKPAWLEIKEAFGEDFLLDDNSLDRKRLADEVFLSKEKKHILEKIIHKEVLAVIKEKLAAMREYGYKGTVVLDVPIPVKEGFLDAADKVWVVVSDDEIRIKRLMKRRNMSREDAEARMSSQLTQDEYKALAHEVIVNNGSKEELEKNVKELYNRLLADFEAAYS